MSRNKLLAVVLGSVVALVSIGANANPQISIGFYQSGPVVVQPAGYWQCVNFDNRRGVCRQQVWVRTGYIQQPGYGFVYNSHPVRHHYRDHRMYAW